MSESEKIRPKIGLVLGGGGSRGLAHIGVLQVLEREQIPVDYIVGTSMGAIIGVSYALGTSPRKIGHRIRKLDNNLLIGVNLFSSRARQRFVAEQLGTVLGSQTFEDLRIRSAVMAVDMQTGEEVVIQEGPLLPAVLASSAIPAVFPPVEHMGRQLGDGGIIDSLATRPAFDMGADRVIAVDVYPQLEKDNPWEDPLSATMGFQLSLNFLNTDRSPGMLSSLWRGFRIMAWHIHQERLRANPPDVLLRPAVAGYGALDFKDVEGPMQAGMAETEAHLPQIRALLNMQDTL